MTPRKWLWLLLPSGLALAGIMLLIRVSYVRSIFIFPDDVDILIIISGLTLAIIVALMLILAQVLQYRHQRRYYELRQAAMAEHFRFLRRLDHQLKNPLTALHAGLASLALTLTDEEHRQMVNTLEAEAQRLRQLIFNLRKLTDLEASPLDVQVIDVAAFLGEVAGLAREWPEYANRRFSVELPTGTLPKLVGDQDLLLLAFHNLLDNAFKYTRAGDSITLSATIDEGELLIQVRDTGIGIPSEDLPLVGEELYRGGNTENIPGDGIGLAVVNAVIALHEGIINLESRLGEGTTVSLRLPLE